MVLISILAYLTTCCRQDDTLLRSIDPALVGYIREFQAEMTQRGALPDWAPFPTVITYGSPPPGKLGVCYLPANVIIIEKSLQTAADEYKRKSTIFHELVHCRALILSHSDDPASIMYFEHVDADMDNWGEQMDDLANFIKERSPVYKIMRDMEGPP